MTRVPWDYSEAPAPGDETVENLPTEEGRMLGRELARLCDLAEPDVRARFPKSGRRCHDCAFRLGTRPNGCAETLMDAVKALAEGSVFYCHDGIPDGETGTEMCAGFAILVGSEFEEYVQQTTAREAEG